MVVYRIDTSLTKEQCENIIDSLTPVELERLNSYNLIAYDEEINGKISSFLITDRYVFTRVLIFLRQIGIEFKYTDISNDILIGKISFKGTSFDDEIQNFIKNNITVDIILDKINAFGIESLTELDKICLESH